MFGNREKKRNKREKGKKREKKKRSDKGKRRTRDVRVHSLYIHVHEILVWCSKRKKKKKSPGI